MPENGDKINNYSFASVAHLTRYFLSILVTETAGILAHTHGLLFSLVTRDTTHCGWLLPPPRATSTPATIGVDSTLRGTTAQRCSKFKIRPRGDLHLPHLRRKKLTLCAGQVCRLFLSPKKSTCAAGVLVTTRCFVLGPGHGVECSTVTTLTRRGILLRRLSCLVYYCLVCCLPPSSCRLEQDTPLLAFSLRRCCCCKCIAFACAQGIRTICEGRFYCLPTTTRSYFVTVLCCANNRLKEKCACKRGAARRCCIVGASSAVSSTTPSYCSTHGFKRRSIVRLN